MDRVLQAGHRPHRKGPLWHLLNQRYSLVLLEDRRHKSRTRSVRERQPFRRENTYPPPPRPAADQVHRLSGCALCAPLSEKCASKQNIPGSCAGSAGILVGETDYTKVTKETFDRISDSSMEKENGNPLQYSCLGNLMDGGVWRATVHGVAKSRTRLRD